MARLARVIALNTPHHVTQRGNGRRNVFDSDADRRIYLDLLLHHCRLHHLDLLGYCLMSNHVHLIASPAAPDSLALTLKYTHGRYASYHNARHSTTGHLWQGRYYSCPLDQPHLWAALRYVELNPLRAGIADDARSYAWSSAAVHCGLFSSSPLIDLTSWRETWTPPSWSAFLAAVIPETELHALRLNTHTGRPLGSTRFVRDLEHTLGRSLSPAKGGRPGKAAAVVGQHASPLEHSFVSHG